MKDRFCPLFNVIMFLFLGSTILGSQEMLYLDDAIQIGLANNYQLQILQANQEIAKNNNTAANAQFLPTVSGVGSYSFSNTNTQQKFFNGDERSATGAGSRNARAAIEANWVIFDGFRRQAIREQLDLAEQQNVKYLDAEQLQFVQAVQLQYYRIAELQQEIRLVKQSIDLNASLKVLARQKQRIGVGSESEVLQASSQLNADSIQLIGLQGDYDRQKIELNRLLNLPLTNDFMADTIVESEALPDQAQMLEEAKRKNPALLLSQLEEMNIESQITEVKSILYPKLSLSGAYNYNFSKAEVGFLLSNRTFGPSTQLTVNYDIYSGRNLKNELKNIALLRGNIVKDRQQMELDIAAQIADLYASYHNLQILEDAVQMDISVAERNTLLASELYRQGRNTNFEVREAILREIQAKSRMITTTYEMKYIEIQLKAIAGILIE